jgi:hypothetical protein
MCPNAEQLAATTARRATSGDVPCALAAADGVYVALSLGGPWKVSSICSGGRTASNAYSVVKWLPEW